MVRRSAPTGNATRCVVRLARMPSNSDCRVEDARRSAVAETQTLASRLAGIESVNPTARR